MTFYKAIFLAGALALSAGAASAATLVQTFEGNDPFPRALVVGDVTTPAIYKCDGIGDNDGECKDEDGPALGTGSFILSFFEEDDDDDDYSSFEWEFVAGDDGLAPHYIAVKAGNMYDLWMLADGEVRGTLSTLSGKSASHVSFYNTGTTEVPVPAAGFLLLAGLGGLAALRRRT